MTQSPELKPPPLENASLMEDDDGKPLNLQRMMMRSSALVSAKGGDQMTNEEAWQFIVEWADTRQPYKRKSVGLFKLEGEDEMTAMSPNEGASKRFLAELYDFLHVNGIITYPDTTTTGEVNMMARKP